MASRRHSVPNTWNQGHCGRVATGQYWPIYITQCNCLPGQSQMWSLVDEWYIFMPVWAVVKILHVPSLNVAIVCIFNDHIIENERHIHFSKNIDTNIGLIREHSANAENTCQKVTKTIQHLYETWLNGVQHLSVTVCSLKAATKKVKATHRPAPAHFMAHSLNIHFGYTISWDCPKQVLNSQTCSRHAFLCFCDIWLTYTRDKHNRTWIMPLGLFHVIIPHVKILDSGWSRAMG